MRKDNISINKEHLDILSMFKKERSHAEDKLNITLGILFFSLTFVSSLYNVIGPYYAISLIFIMCLEVLFIVIQLLPGMKNKWRKIKFKSMDDNFNIYDWKDWATYEKYGIKNRFDIEDNLMRQIVLNINIIERKYYAFNVFALFIILDLILIIIFLIISILQNTSISTMMVM